MARATTTSDEKITLEINDAPPSANKMWRLAHGRTILSSELVQWFDEVRFAVGATRVPAEWRYYKVEIVVEPKRKSGDVDNRIKPVNDALTRCGFWPDDDRVAFVSCEFGKVNKTGRTIVAVSEMKQKFLEEDKPKRKVKK